MGNYFYRSCTSRVWLKLTEIIVTHYENNRATLFPIHSWLSGIDRLKGRVFTLRSCKQCSRAVSGISFRAKLFATHESIGKWIAKHPARIRLHDLNWTPSVRVSEKPATLNRRNSKTFCVAFQLFSRRNRWAEFPRPRSRCEHRMQNNLSRRSSISWVLRCYWPVISWNCTSVDLNAPVRWNYNFSFFLFFHSQQNSIIKLISMGRAFSGILFSLF